MTNIASLKNVMVEPVSGSIEYESLDGYKCEVQVVIKPDNHIELNARDLFKTDSSYKPIYYRFGLNIDWDLVSIDDINEGKLWNTVSELVEALYECRNDEGSERYKVDFQYRKFVQQAMCIQRALDSQRPEDDETDKGGKAMTEEQVKTYSTKCEIEYSQEYLKRRDMTIIFENTFVYGKDEHGNLDKYMARERICGFYHGEPDEQCFREYFTKGCEAVMEDEWLGALTKTHGCVSKNEVEHVEPKFTYSVVVYGGYNKVPLIRYQRDYDDKDKALEEYHELEDAFRLEHKIFDNNKEEFIAQEDCSAMAIIKCGPYDDEEATSFKSLIDETNLYYDDDYRKIVDYLVVNCNL